MTNPTPFPPEPPDPVTAFQMIAILISLTALFSYLNFRFFKLPAMIGVVLIALLFVLIGLEILVPAFTRELFYAGLLAIPAILLARFVSVALPVGVIRRIREFTPGTVRIMTWGGLRGGISVALALSLPASREREIVLAVTYVIVIFSILLQGLTLKHHVRVLVRQ